MVDDVKDIKNIEEISNNKIFKVNEFLEFNDNISEEKNEDDVEESIFKDSNSNISYDSLQNSKINPKKRKQKFKRENEDTENKLLYHLILLLQDQKINNETLMYIVVELMKYMNNYQIKGKDKKNSILFILKNFINTNNNDISNKEDILIFIDKFLDEFVNIISAISDKKIRIKQKTSCFFPLCF